MSDFHQEPTRDETGSEIYPESTGREDDRNEEIEGSPIPDPMEETGDAEDDPGAD